MLPTTITALSGEEKLPESRGLRIGSLLARKVSEQINIEKKVVSMMPSHLPSILTSTTKTVRRYLLLLG